MLNILETITLFLGGGKRNLDIEQTYSQKLYVESTRRVSGIHTVFEREVLSL